MTHFLQSLYGATWLWLPFLVLFLVQGLYCSAPMKLALFKIALYYIVSAVGLQILLPTAHLTLRTMLFDLTTRVFLFIQAAEILWNALGGSAALAAKGAGAKQQQLLSGQQSALRRGLTSHHKLLMFYAVSALVYLGWTILGLAFAFTLTPGM